MNRVTSAVRDGPDKVLPERALVPPEGPDRGELAKHAKRCLRVAGYDRRTPVVCQVGLDAGQDTGRRTRTPDTCRTPSTHGAVAGGGCASHDALATAHTWSGAFREETETG